MLSPVRIDSVAYPPLSQTPPCRAARARGSHAVWKAGPKASTSPPEEVLAQGLGSYLEVVEVVVVNEHGLGIPRNIRRLVVGPVRVDLRSPVKPLPCIQILDRYTGSLGEAVEDGLVDEHDLCGFGHRQHHQTVIDRPLLQKGWEESSSWLK